MDAYIRRGTYFKDHNMFSIRHCYTHLDPVQRNRARSRNSQPSLLPREQAC